MMKREEESGKPAEDMLAKVAAKPDHGEEEEEEDRSNWSPLRLDMYEFLKHPLVNNSIMACVCISLFLVVLETDATAEQGPLDAPTDVTVPLFIAIPSYLLLLVYIVETLSRIFVLRGQYFKQGWTVDFLVVVIDLCFAILDRLAVQAPAVSFLRVFRFVRLLRFMRIIRRFPELEFLLAGFFSALLSIFWGAIMICIILLTWSIIAVQLINPVCREAAKSGRYDADCDRCPRAFETVWAAFVTFNQHLMFGDNWAEISVPIVEEQFWTLFFFLVVLSTVCLAAMNLILAAIVDRGAKAREEAMEGRFAEARRVEAEKKLERRRDLLQVCKLLGDEEKGLITWKELSNGMDKNRKFAASMRNMGIDTQNLHVFFDAIDSDRSGYVDYHKFVDFISNSADEDLKETTVKIKCGVMGIRQDFERQFDARFCALSSQLAELHNSCYGRELKTSERHSTNGLKNGLKLGASGKQSAVKPRENGRSASEESSTVSTGGKVTGSENGMTSSGEESIQVRFPRQNKPVRNKQKEQTVWATTAATNGSYVIQTNGINTDTDDGIKKLMSSNQEMIFLLGKLAWQVESHARFVSEVVGAPPWPDNIPLGSLLDGQMLNALNAAKAPPPSIEVAPPLGEPVIDGYTSQTL